MNLSLYPAGNVTGRGDSTCMTKIRLTNPQEHTKPATNAKETEKLNIAQPASLYVGLKYVYYHPEMMPSEVKIQSNLSRNLKGQSVGDLHAIVYCAFL